MDKDIVREIFMLLFEIIKALGEFLWNKIKGLFKFIWNRFFGTSDISYHEEAAEQEWGVTGEDKWPGIHEMPQDKLEKPQREVGEKEPPPVSVISRPQKEYEKEEEEHRVTYEGKLQVTPELPDTYGDNRIVLMMRDPTCLFAYWEIKKDIVDRVLNNLGTLARNAKVILRVYDVTDIIFTGNNAHKFFDIEVTSDTENRYIHVDEPNRSFCVDIGFLTPNGTFRILARSNTIITSRMDISEIIGERWMDAGGKRREMFITMGEGLTESIIERLRREGQEIFKEGIFSPASRKY